MKVRIEYKEYEHSEAASFWSRLGGYLRGLSLFLVLGLTYILNAIFEEAFPNRDLIVVSFVASIVLTITLNLLCVVKERKCAIKDLQKQNIASSSTVRTLTDEEMRKMLEEYLKDQQQKTE